MEIQVRDFNYYVEDDTYIFYYLGYDNQIHELKHYRVKVNPLEIMKTLSLMELRYNPRLPLNYNK